MRIRRSEPSLQGPGRTIPLRLHRCLGHTGEAALRVVAVLELIAAPHGNGREAVLVIIPILQRELIRELHTLDRASMRSLCGITDSKLLAVKGVRGIRQEG